MKAWITTLFLFLLLPFSAQAEPPSTASIEKLLTITHTEELVTMMIQQTDHMMRTSVAEMLQDKSLSPKAQASLDRFIEKAGQRMREDLNWDVIKGMTVQIYQDIYTQEEVDAMIAFNETAMGQSIIKKIPIASQQSMEMMSQRMKLTLQRIKADLEDSLQELKE